MVLKLKKVKGSTLIESIVAFTLILLTFALGLTSITQLQTSQYSRNTNALYYIKKIHNENRIDSELKTITKAFSIDNYTVNQEVRSLTDYTYMYSYSIIDNKGNSILKYGFIEYK